MSGSSGDEGATHILASSQFRVQRDCRLIFNRRIGLNEDYAGAALRRDFLQGFNQQCRNPLTPMGQCHSEVIDVNLAAFLFELS
jgi:hypothetical protein